MMIDLEDLCLIFIKLRRLIFYLNMHFVDIHMMVPFGRLRLNNSSNQSWWKDDASYILKIQ